MGRMGRTEEVVWCDGVGWSVWRWWDSGGGGRPLPVKKPEDQARLLRACWFNGQDPWAQGSRDGGG